MLREFSNEMRKAFLLKFTEELIRHTKSMDLFKLEEILKQKEEGTSFNVLDIKKQVSEKLNPQNKHQDMRKDPFLVDSFKSNIVVKKKGPMRGVLKKKRVLKVPDISLPKSLSYLRPVATVKKIDLGKLNPFVNDPNVKTIETEGEGKPIFVTGIMGRKSTGLIFSRQEIEEIIDKFSKESKIPKAKGIFKVVVGNLMIIAMISDKVSSRFVIKKIN